MSENELALKLKRAMRVYSYNNIDENQGLGIFKDLVNGKAVMEISFDCESLRFLPHKCPEPKPFEIKREEPRKPRTVTKEEM